jgi:hypothetical protein
MAMATQMTPGKLLPFEFSRTEKGWSQIESGASRCWKEYQFQEVRGIIQAGAELAMHFAVGLLLHTARAQWLNDGYKGDLWKAAMRGYFDAYGEKNPRQPMPTRAKLISEKTFEGYIKHWKMLPKPEVLAVEYELKPRALIPGAPEWTWRGARLDSIERWRGHIYVGEMKSTSESANAVTDFYALHGQPLLYMALWSAQEVKRFGPLKGVLYDVVKKATDMDSSRCYPRVPLNIETVSHALTWFRKDFTTWVQQSSLIDWNAAPERRPHCMRPYGPCAYRDICLRGRDGALGFEFKDGTPVLKWKPSPGKEVPPWQ